MPVVPNDLKMLIVNHAGDHPDNPVLEGMAIQVALHKQDASETLRKCWVSAYGPSGAIRRVLTPYIVEYDESFRINLITGQHLEAGFPAVLNVIHWTTTSGHSKAGVYVATYPTHMIELDGYDGQDMYEPLIWALYK